MARLPICLLAGAGLLLAALGSGCTISAPTPPVAETSPPIPLATLPPAAPPTATPAGPPPTATATLVVPPATSFAVPAAQESPAIQSAFRSMVLLLPRLAAMAQSEPTQANLAQLSQETAGLMAQGSREIPQMSLAQRIQLFWEESNLVMWLADVTGTYIANSSTMGPSVAVGTPQPVPGTPLTFFTLNGESSTPVTLSTFQVLSAEIQETQNQASDLASGHPAASEVKTLLFSLQTELTKLRQLTSVLSDQELTQLADATTRVMETAATAFQNISGP